MSRNPQHALHEHLAERLLALAPRHPLRVALDCPDAAGKASLADALAALIEPRRPVVRLSIDGFHQPDDVRKHRGELSPEGDTVRPYARCDFLIDANAAADPVLVATGQAAGR